MWAEQASRKPVLVGGWPGGQRPRCCSWDPWRQIYQLPNSPYSPLSSLWPCNSWGLVRNERAQEGRRGGITHNLQGFIGSPWAVFWAHIEPAFTRPLKEDMGWHRLTRLPERACWQGGQKRVPAQPLSLHFLICHIHQLFMKIFSQILKENERMR